MKCGGNIKILAAIEDPKVIRKILEHMGLATKPPPLHPAQGPPKVQNHFEEDVAQQHFEMNFKNFNQTDEVVADRRFPRIQTQLLEFIDDLTHKNSRNPSSRLRKLFIS